MSKASFPCSQTANNLRSKQPRGWYTSRLPEWYTFRLPPPALFVSVLVIVAAVPTQLYDTGFILSVVCVLGLIIMYPLIHAPILKKLEVDPLRLQPEEMWMTWLRSVAKGLWSMVSMSISAWLVSAPLTAYFFGNFRPMGIVANLIVIPLSELVITAGCLSLVTGACVGWVGEVFNHANIALVWLMVNPMEWLAKIPYGNVKIENVPLWSLAVWYGLLAGWVVWRKGAEISECLFPNADCRVREDSTDSSAGEAFSGAKNERKAGKTA